MELWPKRPTRRQVAHSSFHRSDRNVRWEVRPALRTAELLGTTFGLAQDGLTTRVGIPPLLRSVQIAREFDAEFQLTRPPRLVQRVAFAVLGGVAELRNVRGLYVPGSSS